MFDAGTSDVKVDKIAKEDVHNLKNPAYVVKEISESDREGRRIVVGSYVVAWNEEFEKLTNFMPSEISHKQCHELFRGLQECETNGWCEVCKKECAIREQSGPAAIRHVWFNSKDQKGENIKRLVDVYIFPFGPEGQVNKFTLHVITDRKVIRPLSYFDTQVIK